MSHNYSPTSASAPWSAARSDGAGRTWSAPGERYNAVTVGEYYTMPGSTNPEYARALWLGTVGAGGTIILRPYFEVAESGVITDYDVEFTIEAGTSRILPIASMMVVDVSGDIDNIVWLS